MNDDVIGRMRKLLLSDGPVEIRDSKEIDAIRFQCRVLGYCEFDYFTEGSHMITDARWFPARRVHVEVTPAHRIKLHHDMQLVGVE